MNLVIKAENYSADAKWKDGSWNEVKWDEAKKPDKKPSSLNRSEYDVAVSHKKVAFKFPKVNLNSKINQGVPFIPFWIDKYILFR